MWGDEAVSEIIIEMITQEKTKESCFQVGEKTEEGGEGLHQKKKKQTKQRKTLINNKNKENMQSH